MSMIATKIVEPDYENPPPNVGTLYEVVDGEFVESKPMGAFETDLAGILLLALGAFLHGKELGRLRAEMLYLLRPEPRLARRPDISYVSFDRWAVSVTIPRQETWDVVPDLAIEVISPSNSAKDVLKMLTEYFEAGARRVWVVYPEERIIHDYASLDEIHVLRGDASLDGGDVLPGFSVKLADLFKGV